MKRGQGTTFSFEEFIKLAMSVFIAGILIIIIVSLYAWWVGPSKEDATAINTLDNLVSLIQAQEGEEWETYTFISLPQDMAIISFNKNEQTTTITSDYLIDIITDSDKLTFTKPPSCIVCFCVVSDQIITCENIDSESKIINTNIKSDDDCKRYLVRQTQEQFLVTQDEAPVIEISNACN